MRGIFLAAAGLWLILAACGADRLVAPRPPEAEVECKDFDQLMPRFFRAISTGQTEGLRRVIRDHLMAPERAGDPPPVNDVLRAIFSPLLAFARKPPEPGAPSGELCAALAAPPPLSQANPLCEMRRATELFVHKGKGLTALRLVDPLVAGVLGYIVGRPPYSSKEHYREVAPVVSGMCGQNGVCQLVDGLNLVIGLADYGGSSEGKEAIGRLDALFRNPALEPFLAGDGSTYGGENGIVALVEVAMQVIVAMDDPSDLDQLPVDQLPEALRADARAVVVDLKRLLDPGRQPNVLVPLQESLKCYLAQDRNLELIRMLYRLGLEARLPEFGLTNFVSVTKGLREADQRGSLLFLARVGAQELLKDEQAIYSAARVCRTLFSTTVPPGETRSNAENALPVAADLFAQGVAGEALCAIDTLLFGCTGGSQPACGVE